MRPVRHEPQGPCSLGAPNMKAFPGVGKVDSFLILFSLLATQRKWTYYTKCPMLQQQLNTVFSP